MMPPNEPLSNEERELAGQLDRLAPRGGPSADVDARILAASRAALDPPATRGQAKPRWPVALGLAASMVVAVGIAWQLRPLDQVSMVASEAPPLATTPVGDSSAAERGNAPVPAAPPVPVSSAPQMDQPAVSGQASAVDATTAPSDLDRAKDSTSAAGRREAARVSREAARRAPAAVEALAPRERDTFVPPSPPAPPAPPAPSPAASARAIVPAGEGAPAALPFVPEADANGAGETGAFMPDRPLQPTDGQAARPAQAVDEPRARARIQAPRSPAPVTEVEGRAENGSSLDRIEVTGTRVRRSDLQVPVSEDALLDEDEWIERIRTRLGMGDEEAARRSLALFVREHSGDNVPADLLPLLTE